LGYMPMVASGLVCASDEARVGSPRAVVGVDDLS
jgi:hypothetical protein